jgi:hypothetical protein
MNETIEKPRDPTAVSRSHRALLRDALRQHGDLLESLGVSIAEAAWRESDGVLKLHIQQVRLVVIDAIAVEKELSAINTTEFLGNGGAK